MAVRFDPHAYAMALAASGDVATDGQMLFHWDGTHWQPVRDEDGERDAYRWTVKHDRDHVTPDNARKAHKAAILWAPELPTPTTAVVIPCRNGYVHVAARTLALVPADKTLGLQHVLACDFLPTTAPAVRFLQFLETVLPDADVRARVQEYVGYTLTSDARHQLAQFWLGGGANGKGVLANVVQALHGATAAVSLDALDGFRISALIGASLIYVDEVPRARINEQLIKSLIAGETVLVDRKYRDPISLRVRGKWLVLGNHLPTVTDHTTGFWRRWDIVPFDVTIPEAERDPMLAQTIVETELSGVLTWGLEGLLRLQLRGAFDVFKPAAMSRVLHTAKAETNSVQAWFDDGEITASTDCGTPKDDVFTDYRFWCGQNGLTPMASPRFWTRLHDLMRVEELRQRCATGQVRLCNVLLPDAAAAQAFHGASPRVGGRVPTQLSMVPAA